MSNNTHQIISIRLKILKFDRCKFEMDEDIITEL